MIWMARGRAASNNRGVSIATNNRGDSCRVEQSGGRFPSRSVVVFLCIFRNVFESAVEGKGRINGCVHAEGSAIN